MKAMRKFLSVAVSSALILTAPGFDLYRAGAEGLRVAAAGGAQDPLLAKLIADGILTGPNDPVVRYLIGDNGRPTELGACLARYEALKAQEQGLAKTVHSRAELHDGAARIIRQAREATQLLMKEGLIPPVPVGA